LDDFSPAKKKLDEYEYSVLPVAIETFTNLMRREGVVVAWEGNRIVFTTNRLLNMRQLKDVGIIRSYVIVRLVRKDEVVEKG
jgi:hypothetical protein